jgi:hypothetical protein
MVLGVHTFEHGQCDCVFEFHLQTEHRGPVVKTPALYSEGPGFKSRPGAQLL